MSGVKKLINKTRGKSILRAPPPDDSAGPLLGEEFTRETVRPISTKACCLRPDPGGVAHERIGPVRQLTRLLNKEVIENPLEQEVLFLCAVNKVGPPGNLGVQIPLGLGLGSVSAALGPSLEVAEPPDT